MVYKNFINLYERQVGTMGNFNTELLLKHLTNLKNNPIKEEQTKAFYDNLKKKYFTKLDKIKNSSFSERELIAKEFFEELQKFKEDYKTFKENIYEHYNTNKIELVWYYNEILNILQPLSENRSTNKLYIEINNLYKDLFVKYYYNNLGNRIYEVSPISVYYITLNDTEWQIDIGKDIEFELNKDPDKYIEITREEAETFEEFFMQDLNIWYTSSIRQAVTYATFYYHGMKRKISGKPYISHALETLLITSSLTSDESVLITSVLHGLIKNTRTDIIEVKKYFGLDVAKRLLYLTQMEDNLNNDKKWSEAKKNILYKLDNASIDIKIIILSNELSKLRETDRDFQIYKDSIWQHFSETDKKKHRWYHEEVLRRLYELRVSRAYEEYQKLIYIHLTNIFN